MKRIRVAHLLNQLALGGTEYNVLKLLNRLDRTRFEPIVVALRDARPYARELVASDVPIWELNRREGFDPALIGRLSHRLRAERVDIVHSHNWSTFLYGVLSARLAGVPVVIHGEHGLEVDNLVENRLRIHARRVLARMTDHFAGVSREICERIERRWGGRPDRISYIPNGVDLSRFGQPYPRDEIRASLSIGPGEPVIAGIGAFRPVKDFRTLIRAFARVLERRADARLLLIGADIDHRFERAIRAEAPELAPTLQRVLFVGRRLDVPELLSIVDIYVSSSLYEGMSNTILESMASRKPVVATAVGGTPDLVSEGVTGLLVPPADPEALADRILRLLGDPAKAAALGARGRDRIEREHSFERMIELNAELYETLYLRKKQRLRPHGIAKLAVSRAAWGTGITVLAERLSPGTLTILTYHRILPLAEKRRSPSQPMILAADVFDRQMAELAAHYRVLSLEQVLDHYRSGRPFPRRAVHVTFDDGYRDNYEYALPILTRHSVSATFFLATGPIDTGALLWWDALGRALLALEGRRPPDPGEVLHEPPALHRTLSLIFEGRAPVIPLVDRCTRILNGTDEVTRLAVVEALGILADLYRKEPPPRLMLTWDQVREMRDQGMSLGGHTVRHAFLSDLDETVGRHEVGTCLDRIEQETATRPRAFSYPAGRTSERTRPWFVEAGVDLAMTTVAGRNLGGEDRYALKRWDAGFLSVEDRFIRSQMRLELSGAMDWAARLRVYRPGG